MTDRIIPATVRNITHARDIQMQTDTRAVDFRLERNVELQSDPQYAIHFVIIHSMRRTLPYGVWTCTDGRKVVFNREYQPIHQCLDGVYSYADRNEIVENIEHAVMYYDDFSAPMKLIERPGHPLPIGDQRNRCKKSLAICLSILREYTPEEHDSVSRQWSALTL